jgi:hypothetical protein
MAPPGRVARKLSLAAVFVAVLALLVAPPCLQAQDLPPLRAEFWMELVQPPGSEVRESGEDAAARLLLDEAAWVFSGMVDGFSFEWTPSDLARAVSERFVLLPAGRVERGDPRLRPGAARREGEHILAWVEFAPDATDRAALSAYRTEPWKPAQGRGGAALELGFAGRRSAYEDATREALRSLLRSLEPNKPRLVRGRAAFQAAPAIARVAGRYLVSVRLRVEVTEVQGYGVF